MSTLVAGLFLNTQAAGEAVADLKNAGIPKNISLVSKDDNGELKSHVIKENVAPGVTAGAVAGTALGALTGLIAGAVSAVIPGAIILVAGPLAATWGITGAAVGALSGGIIGGLLKLGFPQDKAKMFEEHILRGEVLVTAEADDNERADLETIMKSHGAVDIATLKQ